MELGLSLGEAPKAFQFMERSSKRSKGSLGFFMEEEERGIDGGRQRERRDERDDSVERPLQLELLPLVPVPRYPSSIIGHAWPAENGNSDSSATRGFDVNQLPVGEEMEDGAVVSSPNSAASSFQRDFSIYRRGPGAKTDADLTAGSEIDPERASSRASDEEENGLTRKKLRLSKEQSAFLEESFKEHNTLNPKQKLALAKQLNLRPRQVEVWFQNRRARTKLKQTEVDCEYLKRCCETLTEENRRLQKELQELRALKTAQPFYMQLPATTLTMCPSCERVATTNGPGHGPATESASKAATFNPKNNRFYPFPQPHQSAAS